MEKEYFIDDKVIIPERIRKMTPEEKSAEIARLEKEGTKKKQEILRKQAVH